MMYFKEDLKRYGSTNSNFFLEEPSWIIIGLYRICKWIRSIRFRPLKVFLNILFLPWYMFFSIFLGIHIPRSAMIGPGLRIYHYGCIVINHQAVIGSNCTLRQGVTIGNKSREDDVPVIGNDVNIGAGAKIIGKIVIGNNVSIGANAVVITDIPDNSIAIGIPARIIKK